MLGATLFIFITTTILGVSGVPLAMNSRGKLIVESLNSEDHKPSEAILSFNHERHLLSDIFGLDITKPFDVNGNTGYATFMFEFDLNAARSYNHQPGLPSRLQPSRQGSLLSIPRPVGRKETYDTDYNPLLEVDEWLRQLEASAYVVIEYKTDGSRKIVINSWLGPEALQQVEVVLPVNGVFEEPKKVDYMEFPDMKEVPESHKGNLGSGHMGDMTSMDDMMMGAIKGGKKGNEHHKDKGMMGMKSGHHMESMSPHKCHELEDALYHYYRGANSKYYSEIQQMGEYVHTILIGFLSPIIMLGLVFAAIALGVYVSWHFTEEKETTAPVVIEAVSLHAVDEKKMTKM